MFSARTVEHRATGERKSLKKAKRMQKKTVQGSLINQADLSAKTKTKKEEKGRRAEAEKE